MGREQCDAIRVQNLLERRSGLLRGNVKWECLDRHFTPDEQTLLLPYGHGVTVGSRIIELRQEREFHQIYRWAVGQNGIWHEEFRCRVCGKISQSPQDVVHLYCGYCRLFAQDRETLNKVQVSADGIALARNEAIR